MFPIIGNFWKWRSFFSFLYQFSVTTENNAGRSCHLLYRLAILMGPLSFMTYRPVCNATEILAPPILSHSVCFRSNTKVVRIPTCHSQVHQDLECSGKGYPQMVLSSSCLCLGKAKWEQGAGLSFQPLSQNCCGSSVDMHQESVAESVLSQMNVIQKVKCFEVLR